MILGASMHYPPTITTLLHSLTAATFYEQGVSTVTKYYIHTHKEKNGFNWYFIQRKKEQPVFS